MFGQLPADNHIFHLLNWSVLTLERPLPANENIALHAVVLGDPVASNDNGEPPIVVLHGWGHNLEILRPLGELLSDGARVHLIDLPGHGKTPAPMEIWGTEEFSRCVVAYLDAHGIAKADFVGHSFGGKTSLKLASLFPERVNRLVLINTSGLRPIRSFKKRARFALLALLRRAVKTCDRYFNLRWFEKWFVPKFASPDYLNAGPLLKTFVKTVNEDLTEDVRKIRAPALLLWGELDTETPQEMAYRLQKLLTGSELVMLTGKGHVPFLDSGAHLCMFHIKPFLRKGTTSEETTRTAGNV